MIYMHKNYTVNKKIFQNQERGRLGKLLFSGGGKLKTWKIAEMAYTAEIV